MPLPNSGNSHVVLSHLVIIDALCNKIVSLSHKKAVALFNNRPSHFIITLEHFVINLKWMVGGQLIPTISHALPISPDLLFDCSRVLEYAKIRTVLQCILVAKYGVRRRVMTALKTFTLCSFLTFFKVR